MKTEEPGRYNITLCTSEPQITATFQVMRHLRTGLLSEQDYLERVRRQQANGYHLVALHHEGKCVSVAGFSFGESLARGRHVYVDDLVTDPDVRGKGYGAELLDWIADHARNHGCSQLHLDSNVNRFAAHRFYLEKKFDITAHHFRLVL
ncbi:MAG: GNAT family N-acetyltransferase [Phycisphaerae bacterium]